MSRPAGLAAMGKLHRWDEYVAINAGAPSFVTFDRWVAENMDAAALSGAAWPSHYRRGRVHAFVYAIAGASPFLAGAMAPSEDSAGRSYPLFAAREVEASEEVLRSLESLPLLLEDIWEDASRVVALATKDGSPSGLQALMRELPSSPPADIPSELLGWEEWTRGVHLGELSELLFDAGDALPLAFAVRAILEAVAPHRGVTPPRTRLSLRLPLGRAGGAAVCFWLSVVQRALGWERVVPSFFWTHDGDSGWLLMYLGAPPRGTLAQLWMPGPADDVVDLLAPGPDGVRAPLGDAAVERALKDDGATVLELLDAL